MTSVDLFVFGNRTGPRPPRIGVDFLPDDHGNLQPDRSPTPQGASAFANPLQSGLTGHYHRLPAGTVLPRGFAVTPDGNDVLAGSQLPETHHTIHVVEAMTPEEFIERFLNLPWEYGGRV